MAPPPYLIVWDLDGTLGVFDGMRRLRDLARPVDVELRPGIGAALDRLSAEGFAHTVLTMASLDYAELILRGAGLREHFLEVASPAQRPKGDAQGIGTRFGIPEAVRPARMLFVGDQLDVDAPDDPRVLFHFENRPLRRPANRLVELVLGLRERGHGSLAAGFTDLRGEGQPRGDMAVRDLGPAGDVLLVSREDGSPIVACKDTNPVEPLAGHRVTFVPAEAHPELAQHPDWLIDRPWRG